MKINLKKQKAPLICIAIITFIFLLSIISWISMKKISDIDNASNQIMYAHIYQNGIEINKVNLSNINKNYQETFSDNSGNYNTIEFRHNSIGIIDANCPDKLCIHMGFIHNSLLPITCLPNHLVIQIEIISDEKNNTDNIDGFAY